MPAYDGQQIGQYQIVSTLGAGGMATVYKAYHSRLNRYVAIKMIHTAQASNPAFIARFEREAQIIAHVEHSNIVTVYDFFEHDGNLFLVMKFIDGCTLKAALVDGPLLIDDVLTIMPPIAAALDYAHSQGVLHRDIKPSNIMLDYKGTPYLTDFGLAKLSMAGESSISENMLLGTPFYMSPEQGTSTGEVTKRSDLYSLGVVLYELIVGRLPFPEGTPYAIIHDHIYKPLPLPSDVNPNVPKAVELVLLRALSKDPLDRYASAGEMITELRAAFVGDPGSYNIAIPGAARHPAASSLLKAMSESVMMMQNTPPMGNSATNASITPPVGNPASSSTATNTKTATSSNGTLLQPSPRAQSWMGVALVIVALLLAVVLILNRLDEQNAAAEAVITAVNQIPAVQGGDNNPNPGEVTGPFPPSGVPLNIFALEDLSIADAQARLEAAPEDEISYLTLARAQLKNNDVDAAEQTLLAGVEHSLDPVSYYVTAGGEAVALERISAAFFAYSNALLLVERTTRYPEVREIVGSNLYPLMMTGVPTHFEVLRARIDGDVYRSVLVRTLFARAQIHNGQYVAAGLILTASLRNAGAFHEATLIRGELNAARGDMEGAITDWETVLADARAPRWTQDRARELLAELDNTGNN